MDSDDTQDGSSEGKINPNRAALKLLRDKKDKEGYAKVIADLYSQGVQVDHDIAISLIQELSKVTPRSWEKKIIKTAIKKLGENIKKKQET